MHQQVLDPIGVRVTGSPLDKCDPALAEDIRGLLAEHGVVVFDGQNIDTPTFLAFLPPGDAMPRSDVVITVCSTSVSTRRGHPGFSRRGCTARTHRAV